MGIRLLIADDHTLFVQALLPMLAGRYEVVDVVTDGKALQASARKLTPDVIVTDITMPLMSGLDSVRMLAKDLPMPKIVFLTMHADAALARECFDCGGNAFVTKDASFPNLSTRTVEWHKYRMMHLLHIRRHAELVQCALRLKLVF